eukprot:s267_g29.t1
MTDDTIKQLIDGSEDIGTLEKGRKDFNTMWLVGNKSGTAYSGLESMGLCSCRLQLQGQRLVAFASVNELRDFYKQRGIKECLQHFEKMSGEDEAQIPDVWAMPHPSFEFVRTGDVVFCPAGMVVVEKAVETSLTARRADWGLFRFLTVRAQPLTQYATTLVEHLYPCADAAAQAEDSLVEDDKVVEPLKPVNVKAEAESMPDAVAEPTAAEAFKAAIVDHNNGLDNGDAQTGGGGESNESAQARAGPGLGPFTVFQLASCLPAKPNPRKPMKPWKSKTPEVEAEATEVEMPDKQVEPDERSDEDQSEQKSRGKGKSAKAKSKAAVEAKRAEAKSKIRAKAKAKSKALESAAGAAQGDDSDDGSQSSQEEKKEKTKKAKHSKKEKSAKDKSDKDEEKKKHKKEKAEKDSKDKDKKEKKARKSAAEKKNEDAARNNLSMMQFLNAPLKKNRAEDVN